MNDLNNLNDTYVQLEACIKMLEDIDFVGFPKDVVKAGDVLIGAFEDKMYEVQDMIDSIEEHEAYLEARDLDQWLSKERGLWSTF